MASRSSWLPGWRAPARAVAARSLAEQGIRLGLAEIGKIAGDQHEIGAGSSRATARSARSASMLLYTTPLRRQAARPAMQVGDLDDKHRRS